MLTSAPKTCAVIVGADPKRETGLHMGNTGDLPAAQDFILDAVHAAAEFLAFPNRQLVRIVQGERVRAAFSVESTP